MKKTPTMNYKKSDLDKFDDIIQNKKKEIKEDYSIKEAIAQSKAEYSNLTNTSSEIRLYMFQTGTLKTKMKYQMRILKFLFLGS
jgi:hypothetical protein